MSQIPSGVHSPGTVLSPSTTRTIAFFMFALAVPKEFFISAGTGVIFWIIGKTYSSTLRIVPEHHAERVRGDVRDLDQRAVVAGKLLAHFAAAALASPALVFLAEQREHALDRGADRHRFVRAHVVGDRDVRHVA